MHLPLFCRAVGAPQPAAAARVHNSACCRERRGGSARGVRLQQPCVCYNKDVAVSPAQLVRGLSLVWLQGKGALSRHGVCG